MKNSIQGAVDKIDNTCIGGWCFNKDNLKESVILELYINHTSLHKQKDSKLASTILTK